MQEGQPKWGDLRPKDCIQVTQRVWLTARELQFVTQLYVPFLGVKASALYLVLFGELSPNTYESDVIRLADLLAMVNLGIPDFYQARTRLESVGLLKTFKVEDEESFSAQYTFELQAPASPSLFFKDALLATMLLNQVGHQRFERLKKQFLRHTRPLEATEITTEFEEGFQVPFNMSQYRRDIESERLMVQDVRQQERFVPQSDMDWELLTNLLKSQFIKEDALTPEVKQSMDALRQYYGLSEREISQYAILAADLTTGEIDSEELLNIIMEAAQELAATQKTKEQEAADPLPTVEDKSPEENTLVSPLQDPIKELVRLAEMLTPHQFIASIKRDKGGYVTKGEQILLLDLLQISQLPAPVINILIHYLLVIQNNPTLTKNITDAIANDLAQKNIKTAQEAMESIRQHDKNRQVRRQTQQASAGKKRYSSQKNGRIETVPEWAKQKNTTKEQPVDDTKLKDLQAQIANLKTSKQTP